MSIGSNFKYESNVLKVGGYGTLLGGALAGMGGEQEDSIGGERNVEALRTRLTKAYKELRYPEEQIPALVEADLAEIESITEETVTHDQTILKTKTFYKPLPPQALKILKEHSYSKLDEEKIDLFLYNK